ncbi:MAG: hypothetical protein AAGH15_15725 [Myxococcota bacterium]
MSPSVPRFRDVRHGEHTTLAVEGACVVFAMRAVPTMADIRSADALQRAVLDAQEGQLAWMNVMAWGPAPDDRGILPVGNRMFRRPDARATGLVNVFLGKALLGGTTRTIIRMAIVAARPKYPYLVSANLMAATRWLAQRMPDDAPWAVSAEDLERVARAGLRAPSSR